MTDATFKTTKLEECHRESDALGETNDCTVFALAAATNKPYVECHMALRKHGRPHRKGPSAKWVIVQRPNKLGSRRAIGVPALSKAARDLGFDMRIMDPTEYRAKTMTTAPRDPNLLKGHYICMTRGHVAGLVNGQVVDWTDGRRHRIKEIYEITPIDRKTWIKPVPRKESMKAMTVFDQASLF